MLRKAPQRLNILEHEEMLDLPNLIETQVQSFAQFLQQEKLPHERESIGLQEIFQEIFPIKSYDERVMLEFLSYSLGFPKYSIESCFRRGVTYSAPLRVRLRLTDGSGVKEEEVYMGNLPLMTARGTFIINGAERVIVSQLHRSPGIFFEKQVSSKGASIYSFRIIPYRGSWLEASFDSNDLIHVYVDRKRRKQKMLATAFIRILGYSSDAEIMEEFFRTVRVEISSDRVFPQLIGKILAEDVLDRESGVLLGKTAEKLTTAMLKEMLDTGVQEVLIAEDADAANPVLKMLDKDPTGSYEAALKDFYRKMYPGEPATLSNARAAVMRLFFDPRRYSLGRVGRYKIGQKLGFATSDTELDHVTLRKEDILASIKYLIALWQGKEGTAVDDIDHLANRRVRSVGELLQNQCRIGLARMERLIKERINLLDSSSELLTPSKILSAKGLSTILKEFFGRSQLSQFMDQTNPVAELTHKRRLSSLGPGGLNRERAGFEVRDVHTSHYGRICPIETPEGGNIGLITSLSTYAKINEFGFIETPYRIVRDGVVSGEIEYLTAAQEEQCVIAQASSPLDAGQAFIEPECWVRSLGEPLKLESKKITHLDVSPKQLVSVVAGLIPFLEHDDANRALMGSNMQRQAVPLLETEAPLVGTGLEGKVARDSGALILATEEGVIEEVNGLRIVVAPQDNPTEKMVYPLQKFIRSNAGTCLHQKPICMVGERVKPGDVLADGAATDHGEVALGKNVLVAFMPWGGYSYEDAIIISDKLVQNDTYTSIYLEEFEVSARYTKLGKEEITCDIPNVSEEALAKLGADGIIQIGARVQAGDILVGKITPKTETELSPEERLLRAIFGEKAADVKDASLLVPPGTEGVVMDVRVFRRQDRMSKSEEELAQEVVLIREARQQHEQKNEQQQQLLHEKLGALLLGEIAPLPIEQRRTGEVLIASDQPIDQEMLAAIEGQALADLILPDHQLYRQVRSLLQQHESAKQQLRMEHQAEVEFIRHGDAQLDPGVIQQVKVYISSKRKLQVGDKMAGRHGNKGVVSRIVPAADMPYLADGQSVEIILNPLGVPSRMNMGQLLETHLGIAAQKAGIHVKSPVFASFPEAKIWQMMEEQGLPSNGKMDLYNGYTGERFDNQVVVGYIYMMKLSHLVSDKIHARSIGPYSLVTQQPLGGKAQRGGQRFGEMEVWALEAFGAAHLLREMLTVKSDDVDGRMRTHEAIVKGENLLRVGTPESFNVLIKEMRGLCFDVRAETLGGGSSIPFSGPEFQSAEFDQLSIRIASEEVIRQEWSHGEIKKPETINYRTFKPEKGGLFCEKIFGPTRDWECACGKYKRIKHKGIICDRCGVEVTQSKVRRQRMAHIDLAVPVVHVCFFKSMPSRMGNLLGMSINELERVVYYEEYVVLDRGETGLEKKQLLSENAYREAQERWGVESFRAAMGAEAIRELLAGEDFAAVAIQLKEKLRKTRSLQGRMKIAKRLKIVEGFVASPNNARQMVLSCVPVIPPELRPLVPLEGGRFATSDLNELYRRVINRNNRLKAILKLKTPEVIVRNEKRMLQEAVDALFDNHRHPHPVLGVGNRPLKSLSEMLKGKQGRFRQNLLGKRVDYSGRSVIVVGPELKFNQCGLPKQMALELFEPFIIKRLRELGAVYTIRAARKMIREQAAEVWDVLDEVIKGHPILLNRAPTLHRLGIQAFEPVLIEGKAIRVHPLVCAAFNADFDGDQMAVHVPLSLEAQIEAKVLMMAPDNLFLPSSGKPVAIPSQDMILGLYYLMHEPTEDPHSQGKVKVFSSPQEVLVALHVSRQCHFRPTPPPPALHLHERIWLRLAEGMIETTPGRVVFNTIVPAELGFQNYSLRRKEMSDLILQTYKKVGLEATVRFLDDLKGLGFREATQAALSMGIRDVEIPDSKQEVVRKAYASVQRVEEQYAHGIITSGERHAKIIAIWTETADVLAQELFDLISQREGRALNPLHLMMDSGARGNRTQVRQLGALRGLMANPAGEILEFPITSNFREGLSVLEYFISSHGARKGLADTALKTADSGYLTRRLVDVAQDVLIAKEDCATLNGIEVAAIYQGQEELLALKERLFGRVVCEDLYQPGDRSRLLAKGGDLLTFEQAEAIADAGIEVVKIRSPLTCELQRGICAKCYGINLANGRLIDAGEAVGIIAAQSIGEPGTQLTMRVFHLGGIAATHSSPELVAEVAGVIIYLEVRTVQNSAGQWVALNRSGSLHLVADEGRGLEECKKLLASKSLEPLQSFAVELGTQILVADGASVGQGQRIALLEQHHIPILCERAGYVQYEDLVEGISTQREINKQTDQTELFVKQHQGELHPRIVIYADRQGQELIGTYSLPTGAVLSVHEGQWVAAGSLLARLPRGMIKTRDITGGLPRVAELFEARRPKDVAEIAKIDGVVDFRGVQRNKRVVVLFDAESGMEEEHLVPLSKHLIVQQGEPVLRGQQLTDGLMIPHEILEICGVRGLQKYLVNQVQEVYRLQGVEINDKHLELIVRQMLRKVRVTDPGDTPLFFGEEIEKRAFHQTNRQVAQQGGKPAQAVPVLLGITKASLGTDSWISAASFQETTRILTDAAFEGRTDYLLDFKSNLIMGHTIPGGTGFPSYKQRLAKYLDEEDEEALDFSFAEPGKRSS